MKTRDKRVDAYIIKSEEFAKPILNHLRELVHQACPQVEETIKWGFPHFEYKGNLCHMASFKKHCVFGFWKGAIMQDNNKILEEIGKTAMGHLGRITSINDLPDEKILIEYITQAAVLNDNGVKLPSPTNKPKKELVVPKSVLDAISKNKKALQYFNDFSYSNKKDYVEWIMEAKTDATMNKRLETTVEWLSEGKTRNWKYIKK
ncbi:MAG: DUF1801 domain-containing protein [Bacteroidetes bacterium]|nr:DUF1801 domain-containing protein [Bacteroidota bacterium]HET6243000.1 DUF1801 domain-containing protein [Bacteroidia bacterium]